MSHNYKPSIITPERALAVGLWVTVTRGALATILGLGLLFFPDKTLGILANFMGGFWMSSGVMSLRWSATGEHPRPLALIAGIIGVLAGIVMLTRHLFVDLASDALLISILGGIILLTGILHAVDGFRTEANATRQWSWTSFTLGIFEIVLGGLLILSPTELRPGVYWAATVWAFLGAFLILGDAMRQRAQIYRLRQAKADNFRIDT